MNTKNTYWFNTNLAADATVFASMNSADYRIRVKTSTLTELLWQHSLSYVDDEVLRHCNIPALAMSQCLAGGTEWISVFENKLISLGWDWIRSHDGSFSLVIANAPRSNLCLIDEKGYDMSPTETDERLTGFLSTFNWQECVSQAISAGT